MKSTKKLSTKEKHRQPIAAGVKECICYEAKPKDIRAYFSGFIYPAIDEKEKKRYEVSVQTRDGESTLLWTEPLNDRTLKETYKKRIAKVILTHYFGGYKMVKLDYYARKLVEWPGHGMCRLTIHEIHEFLGIQSKEKK